MAIKNSRARTERQSSIEIGESSIRIAAYYIWEKEGRPDDDDLRHWYLAIAELSSTGSFRHSHKCRKPNQSRKPEKDPCRQVKKEIVICPEMPARLG